MSKKAGTALSVMAMVFMGALASPLTVLAANAEETYQPALYATIWALLPPLVAIILALITKEVYSSLFVGIVVGALLYSGFKFEGTVTQIFVGRNHQGSFRQLQCRYSDLFGNPGISGVYDEQGRRLRRIRKMGQPEDPYTCRCRACSDHSWYLDLY